MTSLMNRLLRGELTSAELPERLDLGELNTALANLDVCARYGLAFYEGRVFEELREVYRP